MERPRRFGWMWGALIGAAIGLAAGAAIYLAVTPMLESSTGIIRELQGFAWNLVPGLTVAGGVLGGLVGSRLSRRRSGRS